MIARCRPAASAVAAIMFVAAVAVVLDVSPARAGTQVCQSIPVTTPGSTFTIAGQTVRVPSVSNPRVCATTADAPLPSLVQGGGTCTTGCVTVYLRGDIDVGALSVSYTADGITTTQGVDPGAVSNPGDGLCLVSVGVPTAPVPSCTMALGVDNVEPILDTITELVDTITALVETVLGLLPTTDEVCEQIPDSPPDPETGSPGYDFCTDPVNWARAWQRAATDFLCEGQPCGSWLLEKIGEISDLVCSPVPEIYNC